MPSRSIPEKFQVAFSFAGEQRDLVRSIAEALETRLGVSNVFFDEWFEYYIAGDDADLRLQEIYSTKCMLAIVCVSERYGNKPWTLAEHAAIRARQMKARTSPEQRDRLGILPIRVGDGEIKEILFNTIVPDVRSKPIADTVDMIMQRLQLIEPTPSVGAPSLDWPHESPQLRWPMANHSEVRAEFEVLLTRAAPWRVLLVRGPSETGKSHITKQMITNALRVPGLACGRFDFKGTADLDNVLREFVTDLGVPPPQTGQRLSERLNHVLDQLKQRAQPTLLVFDTYEAAGEGQAWIETQLLRSAVRAAWLRVVVAGQTVPNRNGAVWEPAARASLILEPPPPAAWFEYGKAYKPELTLEFVETACKYAAGKASVLQALVGPEDK